MNEPHAIGEPTTLIVNGDDFGRTPGVNRGVIRAHQAGILTSASIMVRWSASGEAAAFALESPELSLGIHLDLGEWFLGDAGWEPVYEIVDLNDADRVRTEVANQLGRFHKLMGRSPTHIDSHQHVHQLEPVRSVVADFAQSLGCPVRGSAPGIAYCGEFYGQDSEGATLPDAISAEALESLIRRLRPGVTELACHPAEDDDFESVYGSERLRELDSLCDPGVRNALDEAGVVLVSYHDVRCSRDGSAVWGLAS